MNQNQKIYIIQIYHLVNILLIIIHIKIKQKIK